MTLYMRRGIEHHGVHPIDPVRRDEWKACSSYLQRTSLPGSRFDIHFPHFRCTRHQRIDCCYSAGEVTFFEEVGRVRKMSRLGRLVRRGSSNTPPIQGGRDAMTKVEGFVIDLEVQAEAASPETPAGLGPARDRSRGRTALAAVSPAQPRVPARPRSDHPPGHSRRPKRSAPRHPC